MILPVPFPNSVIFHDLSNYKNIFNDCDNCFMIAKGRGYLSTNSYGIADSAPLKVFNVGSYQVSLAHTLNDLKRVDTSVFKLSEGCSELLSKEYSNPNFGFIICKLSKGREEYHPFGYSHNLLNNDQVFIPTKHYHEHFNFNNRGGNINNSPMFQNFMEQPTKSQITEDWDHEIYLYNVTSRHNEYFEKMSRKGMWSGKNLLNKNKLDYDLGDLFHFEQHKIRGQQLNIDLIGKVDISRGHQYNNMVNAY